ncbi:MAG TPA: enolase C-terminal domain-like protein [Phycisphaerae bacterium]|nr:enolase C-terminal domain-like protein [Phycisphaerae bacterium]
MNAAIQRITIHRLAIPMKVRFAHAAGERDISEPLMIKVELTDGTLGFGETHPRPYVTGETVESAAKAIEMVFAPSLLSVNPDSFPAALEALSELPFAAPDGQCIAAARAGVELALLDAYSRHFRRSVDEAAGWMGLANFGRPGSAGRVRYSGVLGAGPPAKLRRSLFKQRLFGLRDFKLKVALPDDEARLSTVLQALRAKLRSGRATLRLDANGGWDYQTAAERLEQLTDQPIACVEEPIGAGQAGLLPELRRRVRLPLMADESLITYQQGRNLIDQQAVDLFNIRISKNGGFLPAMRLAGLARQAGLGYQIGCMVGETSLLSAVGRRLLQLVPGVRFAEGSFGRFLLRDDVVTKPVRFGYGGRFRTLGGPGWGVEVSADKLDRLARDPPEVLHL